jgi:FkbM family methyltransferase
MILDIIASNQTPLKIEINEQNSISHFLSPQSYIHTILHEQINRDKIYDFFFNGKTDLTVLDAGANVGIFSVFCSSSSKIVYAIEPTPSHFNILSEVVKPFDNIKTINAAVWNKDEDIRFYIVDHNTTSNSAVSPTNNFVTVSGKTLQTLIQENNITHLDLIKMDIEGSEFEVISDELLDYIYPIVDNWFLEVHTYPQYCNNFSACRERIANIFQKHKYITENKGNDGLFIHK